MDFKKLLTGSFVGAIVFFLLGWLVYGILLLSFMRHHPGLQRHINRAEMDLAFVVAGNLLQGFLLTYIFVLANVKNLASGVVHGAVIGFAIAGAVDCIMYGTTVILSKTGAVTDIAAATLISAVAGGIIAAVIGKKKDY